MKNMIGAILGVIIGGAIIILLQEAANPGYAAPYDSIWFLFLGGHLLANYFNALVSFSGFIAYLITWVAIGAVASIFSKKGWNLVRTSVWIGLIQGILSLGHILLTDTTFWGSANRNLSLIIIFASSILGALVIIVPAYPLAAVKEMLLREADTPIPDKIETVCDCGAVFKSNPLICSECGKPIRNEAISGP